MMSGFWQKPRERRWRGWLFQAHLWCGLAIGLWAVVVGLSGSVLVFREEIQLATEHDEHHVAARERRAPLSQVVTAVEERFPEHKVRAFQLLHETERTHIAAIARDEEGSATPVDWQYVHYDPYSGEIRAVERDGEGFFVFMQDLHYNLLFGPTGRTVNGVLAVAMIGMCATGLVIWWPGVRSWKRGLLVRWKAGWKRVNYDLHSAVGFYVAGLLAVLSFTGLFFAFPVPIVLFFTMISGGNLEDVQSFFIPPSSTVVEDAPVFPLDRVMERSAELMPAGFELVSVGLPASDPEAVYRLDGVAGDSPLLESLGGAFVDQYTGELVGDFDTREQPWGIQLVLTFQPIHFGTFGGLWSKALWFVMGLAPGGLFATGFLMWWNRVAGKRYRAWRLRRPEAALVAAGESER